MVLGSAVITAIRMFNYIIHQKITNERVTEDSVAVLEKKKKKKQHTKQTKNLVLMPKHQHSVLTQTCAVPLTKNMNAISW